MKKYILLISLLFSVFVAPAQDFGVHEYSHKLANPLRTLYHKINRYVAREQKLPWVHAVQRRRRAAIPMRTVEIKWDFVSPFQAPQLTLAQQQALSPHLKTWQRALRAHKIMGNFVLKIIHPEDIRAISRQQAEFLTRFLQNGTTVGTANPRYVPAKVEEFEHYLVRLTLQQDPAQPPLYLIINCYTRELVVSVRPAWPGLPLQPLRTRFFKRR